MTNNLLSNPSLFVDEINKKYDILFKFINMNSNRFQFIFDCEKFLYKDVLLRLLIARNNNKLILYLIYNTRSFHLIESYRIEEICDYLVDINAIQLYSFMYV